MLRFLLALVWYLRLQLTCANEKWKLGVDIIGYYHYDINTLEINNNMNESITESVYYNKGYEKGYSDAMEYLGRKFDKFHKELMEKSLKDSQEKTIKTKNESDKK